jgi:hypothetical protein
MAFRDLDSRDRGGFRDDAVPVEVVPASRLDGLERLPDTAGLLVSAAVPWWVPQRSEQLAGQGQVELPVVDPVFEGGSRG